MKRISGYFALSLCMSMIVSLCPNVAAQKEAEVHIKVTEPASGSSESPTCTDKTFNKQLKSQSPGPEPEFLTKSAIAKHRSLTGSGFEQSDRRFPQPTVCCQILS